MTALCTPQPIQRRRREPAVVRAALAITLNGMRKFARLLKNRRNARKLAGMDDRMLADIGLNRSDLRDAYAQPLWRDPTDVLAGRVRDKKSNRSTGIAFGSEARAEESRDEGFVQPRTDRPARQTI